MYFVTGLKLVLKQPLSAVLAKTKVLIGTRLLPLAIVKKKRQRSVSMLRITVEMQEIPAQVMSFYEPSPSNLVS